MTAPSALSARRDLLRVLLLALGVRVALALASVVVWGDGSAFHVADSAGYLEPARSLLATGRFAATDGTPEVFRTPGYPLLLVLGLAVGAVEVVTCVLQILIGCATVALVHAIALEIFRERKTALCAALLYAVEPLALVYTARLASETAFAAAFSIFVLLLLRALDRPSPGLFAGSALALAASAFLRPVAAPLCALVPAGLLVAAIASTADRRRRVAGALLFLVVAGLPVVAWRERNRVAAGYSGFSAVAEQNLLFFKAAAVVARREGVPLIEVQRRLGYEDPERRPAGDPGRWSAMAREAWPLLRAHPATWAAIHLEGMLRVAFDPGAVGLLKLVGAETVDLPDLIRGEFADRGLVGAILHLSVARPLLFAASAALGLLLVAVYGLALLGLVAAGPRERAGAWLLAALALYFVVVAGGAEGAGRYRHPAMPLVSVLAGAGWGRRRRGATPHGSPLPNRAASAAEGRSAAGVATP